MLCLTREPDGEIYIGNEITVKVLWIRGGRVQLGITAPQHVRIDRKEVREKRDQEDAA